jgi:transcriptional regulator with PAS, ATPase and Fis domain
LKWLIPISLQAKLLRVFEDRRIKRVGSNKEIEIDVQVLSSTNRNIIEAIGNGFLREDLYHRIASTEIELPPLRERKEDFKSLVSHFQNLYSRLFNKEASNFPDDVWEHIYNQNWEGNIREFSNFIKNYILFGTITKSNNLANTTPVLANDNSFQFKDNNFQELEKVKYWMIDRVLKQFAGNKTLAAKHLGVSYQGLAYLLKNNNT